MRIGSEGISTHYPLSLWKSEASVVPERFISEQGMKIVFDGISTDDHLSSWKFEAPVVLKTFHFITRNENCF